MSFAIYKWHYLSYVKVLKDDWESKSAHKYLTLSLIGQIHKYMKLYKLTCTTQQYNIKISGKNTGINWKTKQRTVKIWVYVLKLYFQLNAAKLQAKKKKCLVSGNPTDPTFFGAYSKILFDICEFFFYF